MPQQREGDSPPRRKDGKPLHYNYNFRTLKFKVVPLPYDDDEHTHIFDEWGLVDHVVCRFCQECELRENVPYYSRKAGQTDVVEGA
jgi:hypothetical protein